LLATQSIEAVASAATNSGVRKIIGRVDPVDATKFLPAIKLASGEEVEADLFVFACGSWLGKVFPEILGARIFPTRQEVFYFNPPANWLASGAPRLPIWVDETDRRIPYGFPDINRVGIKVSFHKVGPAFDPDYDSRKIGREDSFRAADYLRSRFPDMSTPEYRHAEICHYENTSRGDLLIDRHPSLHNVWFAGGGSGHGFKHAPEVARYLLSAIFRGKSSQRRFQLATKGTRLRKHVV
jgi:glycine/D-amino acid oxidase-like deaminating enzyme